VLVGKKWILYWNQHPRGKNTKRYGKKGYLEYIVKTKAYFNWKGVLRVGSTKGFWEIEKE